MIFSIFILITAFFNQAFAKKEVIIGKKCHENFFHLSVVIEAIENFSFSVDIFGKYALGIFSSIFFSSLARERIFFYFFDKWKHNMMSFCFVYQQFSIFNFPPHVATCWIFFHNFLIIFLTFYQFFIWEIE